MQGVEILTSAQVVTEWSPNMTAFWITVVVVLVAFIIGGIIFSIQEDDWSILYIFIMCGAIVNLILGCFTGELLKTPASYETEYKVIISDEVTLNEFYEHYEVIAQDGKIFTVREK